MTTPEPEPSWRRPDDPGWDAPGGYWGIAPIPGSPPPPPGPVAPTEWIDRPELSPLPPPPPLPEGPGGRIPRNDWIWWMGFAALCLGLVLAVAGGLLVDVPAALLGANINSSHLSPGLEIADTAVQDLAFVAAAVILARSGGRLVRGWQFGLRRPRMAWWRVLLAIAATYLAFFVFTGIWASLWNLHQKEKLLETLGANEGTPLLLLSVGLTCVVAPICEEFLFRGFFFRALANWRGVWPAALMTGVVFGAVHIGSAPVGDLVPLGFLGFCLCWLYRQTGSLLPGIVVHALNNCIAFSYLENWSVGTFAELFAGTLAALGILCVALVGVGVIGPEDSPVGALVGAGG